MLPYPTPFPVGDILRISPGPNIAPIGEFPRVAAVNMDKKRYPSPSFHKLTVRGLLRRGFFLVRRTMQP